MLSFSMERPFLRKITCLLFFSNEFLRLSIGQVRAKTAIPGSIPIGALFSKSSDPVVKTAFMYAMSRYNSNKNKKSGANFQILTDDFDDVSIFDFLSKMCTQMTTGIFLVYGSTTHTTYSACQTYCARLHLPYVTYSDEPFTSLADIGSPDEGNIPERDLLLFTKPSYVDAVAELIQVFGWKTIDYIYSSFEGFQRLEHIKKKLSLIGYGAELTCRRLVNVSEAHEELRRLDAARKEDAKYVIIDVSDQMSYSSVVKQIPEVGMNREGYNYILATLDIVNLDLSRLHHGGATVTGFQMIDVSSPLVRIVLETWKNLDPGIWPGAGSVLLPIEAALSMDVIQAVDEAISVMIQQDKNIFQHTFRRGSIYNMNRTVGVRCDPTPLMPWMHGADLYGALSRVQFQGVSGNFQFDNFGHRSNYSFDIFSMTSLSHLRKIGKWHSTMGILPEEWNISKKEITESEKQRESMKVIITLLQPPFLMKRDFMPRGGTPQIDQDRYEGYTKDLAQAIASHLGIDYVLRIVEDGEYGKSLGNGTWTGMIGQLIQGTADVAIGPLTITSTRERALDFSTPFMNTGISVIMAKPQKQKANLFTFMEPFSLSLWISILLAYIVVSISIFIVCKSNPTEHIRDNYPQEMEDVCRSKITLSNSFWFAIGALMSQGSDVILRTPASRLIGGVWWFFVLIILSSYTANLAAFLTVERIVQPITSVDDLLQHSEISCGMLETGSTREYFETSNISTFRKLWASISDSYQNVMVKSIEEGVQRVQSSGGKYAFILESSMSEYYSTKMPCNTVVVGSKFYTKGFGVATYQNAKLMEDINYVILKLKEDGRLHKLKQIWWDEKNECGSILKNEDSRKHSLEMSSVLGIFLVLIAGLVVAIVIRVVSAFSKKHCF